MLLMVFPKPLGAFYIALLSPFVAAAQKENNRSIVNRVIDTITWAMINFQFHNTFADVADWTKVSCPHPRQASADAYCSDLVTQTM
ncbi:MAG: hypothetical protein A2505_10090 [Deltaproteobacteria bacterium RIFOXYD12_FULL_55_16]|nr:MAG: hypothetical protein A2505_10090 [Deltaproteobacteria bacterium RIFOXYD12_FULL_55_16]